MRLSKVTFREGVADIPNLKGTSSVSADDFRIEAGKMGFEIEYDDEHRFVRVEAIHPITEKDQPVCVPMENVKSFRIVGDTNVKRDATGKPKA